MIIETAMTRQMFPSCSVYSGGVPMEGSSMQRMIPPVNHDGRGEWRFREMKIIEPMQPVSGVGASPIYTAPATECLVVWERLIDMDTE